MKIKLALIATTAAALALASPAYAAPSYDFLIAPVLNSIGRPLADDGGRVDGRTFSFTIGALETPTTGLPFAYPNYRIKSYSYTEFGSTTPVVVPATLGKNIVFSDYVNQGGVSLTNSGMRNFFLYGDTVNNSQAEVLYDDAAYKSALPTSPAAQPVFKLGTFLLSTYPRNNSATQPIQNYTVTISQAMIAAAPEPGTWLMMIVGFGVVGVAIRRRPARLAIA